MSYQLNPTSSIEAMTDYAVAARAGLAVPGEGLEDLAVPFTDFIGRARVARDARDDARHAWIGLVAVYRARDFRWDGKIVALSAEAYHAAGKNADADPYAPLFGTLKAGDARHLGAARATAFGALVVKKANAIGHPALATSTAALADANDALALAHTQKVEAYDALRLHALTRTRLLGELHALIATTEAAILTRFPGDRDRVRATLAPLRRDEREDEAEVSEG